MMTYFKNEVSVSNSFKTIRDLESEAAAHEEKSAHFAALGDKVISEDPRETGFGRAIKEKVKAIDLRERVKALIAQAKAA